MDYFPGFFQMRWQATLCQKAKTVTGVPGRL